MPIKLTGVIEIPAHTAALKRTAWFRHKIRSKWRTNHWIMEQKDKANGASGERPHAAIPLPERFDRPEKKEGNSPQETVGTKTPGLKKDEDMPVATERKARRDGEAPKPKK